MLKILFVSLKSMISIVLILIIFLGTIPFMPLEYIFRNISNRYGVKVWGRLTFWASFNRLKIHGSENLPPKDEKNVLYVSNHLSYMDIPVLLGWVDHKASFVARKSLLKIPIFGTWLKVLGSEFLERKASRKELKTVNRIGQKLNQGHRFYIFPEGTRSRNGKLQNFKRTTRRFFEIENLKIIPIFIVGTSKVLPPGKILFGKKTVIVYIGREILADSADGAGLLNGMHQWMQELESKVN